MNTEIDMSLLRILVLHEVWEAEPLSSYQYALHAL